MGLTLLHRSAGGLLSWLQWLLGSWPADQCSGLRGWASIHVCQHLCGDACWTLEMAAQMLWRAVCVPQPCPSWRAPRAQAGHLPNEPMREGDSAPLAMHL